MIKRPTLSKIKIDFGGKKSDFTTVSVPGDNWNSGF
jgi:hypothetical protein